MRNIPLHNVNEIQKQLADAGLDAAVVIAPRNVWCLTGYPRWRGQKPGYRRSAVAIAYPDAEPTLVTGRYQEEVSLIRGWVRDVRSFADYVESPTARGADVLRRKRRASGRIGLEFDFMTAEFSDELVAGLDKGEIVPCDDLFATTWAVKQPKELAVIRDNIRRLGGLVTEQIAATKPGQEEFDLHKRMVAAIHHAGSGEAWGRTVSGERVALLDALPSTNKLNTGDMVAISYSSAFRNYPGRIARMAIVGSVKAELRDRYRTYVRALEKAVAGIGPGQSGEEIDQSVRAALVDAGLKPRNKPSGHAIGLGYYERPSLRAGEKLRTAPGMVLTVEPETMDGLQVSMPIEITAAGNQPIDTGLPPLSEFVVIG